MGALRRRAAVVGALMAVTACGGGGHSSSSSSQASATSTSGPDTTVADTTTSATGATTTSSATPTTSPTTVAHATTTLHPTTTVASQAPAAVALADADTGRSVTVRRGGTVTVVLHSTYWTFAAPSNGSVVQAQGAPVVVADRQGCVPGGGCGTVTAKYAAVGDGQATLSAHRDSCGEAMRCQGTAGDWRVTIVVAG